MVTTAPRRRRRFVMKRKRFIDDSVIIDYKKPDILRKFITQRGKIIPSRVSGATHSQQLAVMKAVKRARYLALIPSSVAHEKEKGFVGEMSDIAQTFAVTTLRNRSDYRNTPFRSSGNFNSEGSEKGEENFGYTNKKSPESSVDGETDQRTVKVEESS